MENIINNLKEKSILHQDQVMNIKKYISEKYEGEEASRKAAIFADAVRNIVDQSVKKFEKQHRLKIRAEVLKSAIAKDVFDISGYDVFEVCSLLPIDEDSDSVKEQFFINLTDWINENQDIEVTLEEMKVMSSQIIDAAVFEVVNLLEESVLIEPEIKEFAKNHEQASHKESEYLKDSLELSKSYDDNPDLADHITDGRFMDVKGDIVELSICEIENAIKESMELYGDLDDIDVDEQIDKTIIQNEINKKRAQNSDKLVHLEEEKVFDSMDFLNDSSNDEDKWTKTKVTREKKRKTTSLSGYQLKPPLAGEESSGVTFKIKLIIIIPAVLVTLALIIILILGAMSVSKKNVRLEEEIRVMRESALDVVTLVSETVPEAMNDSEGDHLAEILKYKAINPDLLKEFLEDKNWYVDVSHFFNDLSVMILPE